MGYFDYSLEPQSDIAFVDMKSFYASVELCGQGSSPPESSSLCHEPCGQFQRLDFGSLTHV